MESQYQILAFLRMDRMGPNGIWAIVKKHAKQAGIRKNANPHISAHMCHSHDEKRCFGASHTGVTGA
jgi:site-specific recombinase XerD